MIGDNVIVSVLGIKGNQIKIGIEAPKDVVILREEIIGKPKREKNEPKIKVKKAKLIGKTDKMNHARDAERYTKVINPYAVKCQ